MTVILLPDAKLLEGHTSAVREQMVQPLWEETGWFSHKGKHILTQQASNPTLTYLPMRSTSLPSHKTCTLMLTGA